jgi:hypothetical protein
MVVLVADLLMYWLLGMDEGKENIRDDGYGSGFSICMDDGVIP